LHDSGIGLDVVYNISLYSPIPSFDTNRETKRRHHEEEKDVLPGCQPRVAIIELKNMSPENAPMVE
jgi:hypothetical protein